MDWNVLGVWRRGIRRPRVVVDELLRSSVGEREARASRSTGTGGTIKCRLRRILSICAYYTFETRSHKIVVYIAAAYQHLVLHARLSYYETNYTQTATHRQSNTHRKD